MLLFDERLKLIFKFKFDWNVYEKEFLYDIYF